MYEYTVCHRTEQCTVLYLCPYVPVKSHILYTNVNSIYCELLFYVKLSETEYVLLYCVYWPVMPVHKFGYTSIITNL